MIGEAVALIIWLAFVIAFLGRRMNRYRTCPHCGYRGSDRGRYRLCSACGRDRALRPDDVP